VAKRAIGIDLGPQHCRAVQMVREGDRLRVEKACAAPVRRSTDRHSEVLLDLAQRYGLDWRADTALALPAGSVFYRDLPSQDPILDPLRQGDGAALVDHIPVAAEDMLVRICEHPTLETDRPSVLVAVTSAAAVQTQIDLAGQVRPRLVETEAYALWNAVSTNHPEAGVGRAVIGYLEASHTTLVMAQSGQVVFVRSVPWTWSPSPASPGQGEDPMADLIQATFQKVFGCGIEADSTVYLASGDGPSLAAACAGLRQALGVPVVQTDPYARVLPPEDGSRTTEILVAQGLAIRALAPRQTQGVDFLRAEHGPQQAKASLRREWVLCATLACAIGLVWIIGLWTQRASLESRYTQVKAQMSDLFRKSLPGEKQTINPLAQVQKRLDQVKQEAHVLAPSQGVLVVLERLGASRQGIDVVLRDLLIDQDGVRMEGTCSSFEQVYQWQQRLKEVPQFARVQVEQPVRDPKTGQVSFTILIPSGPEEGHDRT